MKSVRVWQSSNLIRYYYGLFTAYLILGKSFTDSKDVL